MNFRVLYVQGVVVMWQYSCTALTHNGIQLRIYIVIALEMELGKTHTHIHYTPRTMESWFPAAAAHH